MTDKDQGNGHLLKVRDYREVVRFKGEDKEFTLCDGTSVSWAQGKFGSKELREQIEPWLTSLFQSEHLSLLVGSGLTRAVHHLAACDKQAASMAYLPIEAHKEAIEKAANLAAQRSGRGVSGNLEDQLRAANELLRGLEILGQDHKADAETLSKELRDKIQEFAESILGSEKAIAEASESTREQAFNALVSFLMSFASRTGTRDRLNIFTTNYDRLIEAGAEIAGIRLLDRFVGNLMPIFRASRLDVDMHYNPPGIRGEPRYLEGVARFSKLHGSVDWIQTGLDIRRIGLPFGAKNIKDYLKAPGLGNDPFKLMIYPNAAKDIETTEYPYVELFRDFASAICRPNSTLVTYGYGFGDEHINRVIRDMLTIPSTHLVAIAREDTYGRIVEIERKHSSQVSLLIGSHLADLGTLTNHYLPKPAIDKASFRMNELLKQRMPSSSAKQKSEKSDAGESSSSA